MVDPTLTFVAGIAFLVLLIAPVLYLMYTSHGTEDDESPGESVVGGAGPVAEAGGDTKAESEAEAEAAEAEAETAEAEAEPEAEEAAEDEEAEETAEEPESDDADDET